MPSEQATVCVFAPSLFATVTVEQGEAEFAEIHFHVGGQGFWIARMVRELGERAVLCGPVGGETGDVIRGLVGSSGVDFAPVKVVGSSPAYLHDRRAGERAIVAESQPPPLSRHEVDDLFGRTLRHAISAGTCVVTGRPRGERLETDFYRRLAADLSAVGVRSVGDLHGDELRDYLIGGPLDVLKVSDEDLSADEGRDLESDDDVWKVVDRLCEEGARAVVVSRGGDGALARFGEQRFRVRIPRLEVVDEKGAGDSMTAALAVALLRDLDPPDVLRWASAAGAANVTRHGLGSSGLELVEKLTGVIGVLEVE